MQIRTQRTVAMLQQSLEHQPAQDNKSAAEKADLAEAEKNLAAREVSQAATISTCGQAAACRVTSIKVVAQKSKRW